MSNAIYLVVVFAVCLVLATVLLYDKSKTIEGQLKHEAEKLQRQIDS